MRFDYFLPTEKLRPYIRHFVLSENENESQYQVFPSTGLVMGFQYRGNLAIAANSGLVSLAAAGITGLCDRHRTFVNSADIGTLLVYFTETGFAHFSPHPANVLFNESLHLDSLFHKDQIVAAEEKLASARTDQQRILAIEHFLIGQLRSADQDKRILEAVKLIYRHKGNVRIEALGRQLMMSQSPFEKRFRRLVGTGPKKFASIVRFNTVVDQLAGDKNLNEICYGNNFFDQAHFIKDFKQYTGQTPAQFSAHRSGMKK